MNVLFIINEYAGNGKGRSVWKALAPKLKVDYTYKITQYAGHASAIAEQEAKKHMELLLIIAVGGDGTLHEVIQGISGMSHVTVGALKGGSGNDFTRGYVSFRNAEHINRYIRLNSTEPGGRRKAMDLGQLRIRQASGIKGINEDGKVSKVPFVNNAGIGFDAFVSTTINRSALKRILNKVRLGSLIYAVTVVWALFAFRRFNVTVQQDAASRTFRNVWFIAMCNQPYFGGGMKISPDSVPNDGKIEVTIVHDLARWKLLLVFITVFWGGHTGFKEVSVMKGTTFTFQTDRAMLCHTDGEYLGQLHEDEQLECRIAKSMWYNIDLE